MPVAGVVAGVLCASVGWMVVKHGGRLAHERHTERHDSERALVDGCLANLDLLIDLRPMGVDGRSAADDVIDLTTAERAGDADHGIDLSGVRPRNGPVDVVALPRLRLLTSERPSIWHPPTSPAPR